MKLLIVNQPLENRGDESAHRALVNSLLERLPQALIEVLFVGVNERSIQEFEVKNKRITYLHFPLGRFGFHFLTKILRYRLYALWYIHPVSWKILREMRKSDLVICAPGGICMGGFQSWSHITILYMAKRLEKKIVYYGRSFGPFPEKDKANRRFKEISYELLRYFDFISIRDAVTQKLAEEIGVNYIPTTDSAFLSTPHGEIPNELKLQIGKGDYIVFVPNVLTWHYRYKGVPDEIIKTFFRRILNQLLIKFPGNKILMLPQTYNHQLPITAEMNFFIDLQQSVNAPDRVKVLPDTYGSDIQQLIIGKAKFLIGARYHSIVFAINNNTPFIALSYEHKISGLLETLNKPGCMVDLTTTFENPETIEQTLSEIEKQIEYADKDREVIEQAKKKALKCFDLFINQITKKQ